MRGLPHLFVTCLLWLTIISPAGAAAEDNRPPVPSAAAQAEAQRLVREVFGDKLDRAKTAEAKVTLAKEMIAAAAKDKGAMPGQYVLLRSACDLAAEAGDIPAALDAADGMARRFLVDALKTRIDAFQDAARNARQPAQQKAAAEAALGLAGEALDEDRCDEAVELAALARSAAQKTRQFKLANELGPRLDKLKLRAAASAECRQTAATLEKDPAEPAANLVAGRYLCFARDDWGRGVSMLALGSDSGLKAVAAKDLLGAKTADAMVALGDAWWVLAEDRKGDERDALMRRAAFWYHQAQGQLGPGLARAKVDQRLRDVAPLRVDRLVEELRVLASGPVIPGRWLDLLGLVSLERDRLGGDWAPAGDARIAKGRATLALPVRVEGSYDLEVDFTREQGGETVSSHLPVGATACSMFLSGWGGSVHGLSNVDGREARDNATTVRPGTLANDRRYRLLLQVRVEGENAAITAMLDGDRLISWSGKQKSLSPFGAWDRPWQPGLGTADGQTRFHAARLRLVAGRAELVSPPTGGDAAGARPVGEEVVILSAAYGAGASRKDVTEVVRNAFAGDPFAPIQADDRVMGDPVPGKQKTLVVRYRVGRQEAAIELAQAQATAIPPIARDGLKLRGADKRYTIVAARYGAGLTWLDITPAVAKLATDPARPFTCGGEQVGQDPWFGVHKSVAIWFDYQGKRYVRIMPEPKCVLLP